MFNGTCYNARPTSNSKYDRNQYHRQSLSIGTVVVNSELARLGERCICSYPIAPLVVARERGKENYYPMELLEVLPMQRVTVSQSSSDQTKLSIRVLSYDSFKCIFRSCFSGISRTMLGEYHLVHDLGHSHPSTLLEEEREIYLNASLALSSIPILPFSFAFTA